MNFDTIVMALCIMNIICLLISLSIESPSLGYFVGRMNECRFMSFSWSPEIQKYDKIRHWYENTAPGHRYCDLFDIRIQNWLCTNFSLSFKHSFPSIHFPSFPCENLIDPSDNTSIFVKVLNKTAWFSKILISQGSLKALYWQQC